MDLKDFVVSEEDSVISVMKLINMNSKGIAFLCKDGILFGVITDGDIRRHILKNGSLEEKIKTIANYEPIYVTTSQKDLAIDMMNEFSIRALPILNKKKKLLYIQFLNDERTYHNIDLDIPVVIMAGGKGTRLYPYTQILPKPLIPIGEKTITELIMDHFEAFGCNHFDMIVKYKKNFIKSYFMDNEQKRNVDFIEEEQYFGTGGGLGLLKGKYQDSFFMTNCDIIIEEDYSEFLKYHKDQKNIITLVTAIKNVTIPYGTIQLSETGDVIKLKEKPNFSFMTITGLYIISPRFLEKIPENTYIDITDLIQNCIDDGEKVGAYPISEQSWMDMGQLEELEKMRERLGDDVKP